MNIFIVEDDKTIREGMAEFFSETGYHVFQAKDGEEALKVFAENEIHLMILDIMMPKKDGLEVLQELRKTSNIPVLILSAVDDEKSQIKSFDLMVDGYVNKPFSLPVLAKRVETLLKRHYGNYNLWKYKDAIVNFSSYQATYRGVDADVKPKEIDILKFLLENENKVMSREMILDSIWHDSDEAPYDRVVDVYIKNLRKKLKLDCIVTVKNVGYKLTLK